MTDIKYAVTYWMHYQQEVMFGPDLKALVFSVKGMRDAGLLADDAYWAIDGDSWVEADVSAEIEEYEANAQERYEKWVAGKKQKSWTVKVSGPNDTYDYIGRYETSEEAFEAAKSFPSIMNAEVHQVN